MKRKLERQTARGLCILGRGPYYEAALALETMDLLIERGYATCCDDGEWRLTPAGAAALVLVRRRA